MTSPEYPLPDQALEATKIAQRLDAQLGTGVSFRWDSSDDSRIYFARFMNDEAGTKVWRLTSVAKADDTNSYLSFQKFSIRPNLGVSVQYHEVSAKIMGSDANATREELEKAKEALHTQNVEGKTIPTLIDFANIENALFDLGSNGSAAHKQASSEPLTADLQSWETELTQE